MKPKAKKFRIKRNGPVHAAGSARHDAAPADTVEPAATDPGESKAANRLAQAAARRRARMEKSGDTPAAPAEPEIRADAPPAPPPPEAPAPPSTGTIAPPATGAATDLDAIRREGLTGRQLRMARRVAQKHNLPATSDFDAVRLLRERGIDPFARSNMLELVVPQTENGGEKPAKLPQTAKPAATPAPARPKPSPAKFVDPEGLSPTERREREIGEIQLDIRRRRRRRLMKLMGRLAFFVLLPTIVAGYYFYNIATPLYSSKSEFLILQADNAGGGGIGGLLSGTQFATSQDSIATQSYLHSKDAMLRLDADLGFKVHWTQDWIDPVQRLQENPSNEEAYKTYKKMVKIGYDPTEGVIRMEVTAADPQVATEFSRTLISYAEERVNQLSEQKRDDQMSDAMNGFRMAETERRNAQEALVQLQQQGAILDPEGVIGSLRSQISNVEIQLQEKELQLAALLDNARPNQARVDGVRGDIARLQALLERLNDKMVDASKGEHSLAQLSVRIQMAQADLVTRDMMLQSALQQLEQTRMEANRQVRYLTTSVKPVPSEEPSYPRKFENTLLAFLIFAGAYLMLSLTASILREQVTS